jgi:hypothetical protein
MGHTLVLEVPEDVYESLNKIAEQTGQTLEVFAVHWLATMARNLVMDPLEKFIGAFRSNVSDWADDHDKHIGKSIMETMHSAKGEGSLDV